MRIHPLKLGVYLYRTIFFLGVRNGIGDHKMYHVKERVKWSKTIFHIQGHEVHVCEENKGCNRY